MLEENKLNIEIEDLFSSRNNKISLNVFSKTEREDFYQRHKKEFDGLNELLEINENKKKIIEKEKVLNYLEENIGSSKLFFIDIINFFISMVAINTCISVIVLITIFIFNSNILNLFSLESFIFFLSFGLISLSVSREDFIEKQMVEGKLGKLKKLLNIENLNNWILTALFGANDDTLMFFQSDIKATIFKKHKTDNELYNKILLDEIEKEELSKHFKCTNQYQAKSEKIVTQTKNRYENYLSKENDLKMIEKYIRYQNINRR